MEQTENVSRKKPGRVCHIARELLEAWQESRRIGDSEKLVEYVGLSRPVIDKALKYGTITVVGLDEKITAFFKERRERELADARYLRQLNEEQ